MSISQLGVQAISAESPAKYRPAHSLVIFLENNADTAPKPPWTHGTPGLVVARFSLRGLLIITKKL